MKIKKELHTLIFLLAGILFQPFLFIPYSKYFSSTIFFLSLSSISSLALSFIILNSQKTLTLLNRNKLFKVTVLISFIISVILAILNRNNTYNIFFLSILWISVPLFAAIFNKQISRLISTYITFFFLFDLTITYCVPQLKTVGITGNRNWHAAFLIVGIVFFSYTVHQLIFYLKKHYIKLTSYIIPIIYAGSIIIIVYASYLFYLCSSKAMYLALLLIIIFLVFNLKKNIKKLIYNKMTILFLIIIFLFIVIYFVFNFQIRTNHEKQLQNIYSIGKQESKNDVRIVLWKDCLKLIWDHPLFGIGINNFESSYIKYRSLDYFQKIFNAPRTIHPHNTLLYIAATMGIPILICWCILWIYPLIYSLWNFSTFSILKKAVVLSYFVLLWGGLFDLTLFYWPTLYIAAILLGFLWIETFKKSKLSTLKNKKRDAIGNIKSPKNKNNELNFSYKHVNKIKLLTYIIAFYLFTLTVINIYNTYFSSLYFTYGDGAYKNRNKRSALFYYKKGLYYQKNPEYIYKCGLINTSLNKPLQAIYFFDMLNNISQNFAHVNSYIAKNLIKLNKFQDALTYLEREVICFPLSTTAWYKLGTLQFKLGEKEKAAYSLFCAQKTLNIKKLPPNALRLLIENPEYDFHPERIPKNQLAILNKQLKMKRDKINNK